MGTMFDDQENDIDASDAYDIGQEVNPEEPLTQHHVTDEGAAERNEPRPGEHLRELDQKGVRQADDGNRGQAATKQDDAP